MTTDSLIKPTRKLQWNIYGDKRARAKEKREFVLCWLSEFHYSTRRVLTQALGLHVLGQGGFFQRLERMNLTQTVRVAPLSERLILLTPNGLEHARALTPHALSYNTAPSKITSSTVIHNLSVQLATLRMQRDIHKITHERHLDFAKRVKLPDAIIETGTSKIGLEVELTHKNTARIYRGFIDSIQNIKDGHYARVRYVFDRKLLMEHYVRLFKEPAWPVYERDAKSHRLFQAIRNGAPFRLDSTDTRIQTMFEFVHEELYR